LKHSACFNCIQVLLRTTNHQLQLKLTAS
jgi:hypothetical protein